MSDIKEKLRFIKEIDQLKEVERQVLNISGRRQENTAEHSWSLAMAVQLLQEFADHKPNIDHCIKLALSHDLVEIYAGDTFFYDEVSERDKDQREKDAATKLFQLLDENSLYKEYHKYWLEYEEGKTPESLYVNALDRFLPIYLNTLNQGHSWKKHNINAAQVVERNKVIAKGSKRLWNYTLELIDEAVSKGDLAAV